MNQTILPNNTDITVTRLGNDNPWEEEEWCFLWISAATVRVTAGGDAKQREWANVSS